ncbi:MAG TPA: hypothetical protein VGH80_10525 [Xanthomonadaceae bacterium]|jgi:hypothetical protein
MPTAAHAAAQAIPFRPESHGITSDAGSVFLVLTVVLAVFLIVLLFARKKGWLNRWIAEPAVTGPSGTKLRVEQVLRLSPKTLLYRVSEGPERYLIVESTAQVHLHPERVTEDGAPHA